MVFLKNPLQFLVQFIGNKDIVFQPDSVGVSLIDFILPYFFSAGLIYMKSTSATQHLWMSVLQFQNKFMWNDQAGLNVCIRHHSQKIA